MKSLLTLLLSFIIISTSLAQQGINYKGLIKDDLGNVIANDLVIVQFSILQGVAETNVYTETHSPTTNANGLVILNIGEGNQVNGDYTTIDWANDSHALNVQVNTGAGFVDMGTTTFKTVPYALNAKTAENVTTLLDDLSDAKSDTDGTQNGSSIYIGLSAGAQDDLSDNRNIGIGYQALFSNTTGASNTANGFQSMYLNLSGSNNTAMGNRSMFSNTTGSLNTAQGNGALYSNSSGTRNTGLGMNALHDNTTGYDNTSTGTNALFKNTVGFLNTANGVLALYYNTTGYNNTANGNNALYLNTEGNFNTANGSNSLFSNTTGYANTASGVDALYNNTIGFNNIAVGNTALSTTTTGDNNIGIGVGAQSSLPAVNNEVTIGNSANNVYRMYAASWTNISDRSLKHSIKIIPVGLEFVKKLKPVEYIYNNAKNNQKTFGFVAQDVLKALKDSELEETILVTKFDQDGHLGLRTTELISVLTKAIQEQQIIIENLKKENQQQHSEIDQLQTLNNRVKQLEELLDKNKI